MTTYHDLTVHRWMLRDAVRNEAYRRAIAQVVKPGMTVLDMGAGTGILSVFAAQAGARKVYAVERTGIVDVAQRLIEANGVADRIDLIHSDLEDVTLPEKVDVIISEWMGGFGVDENMLAPLVMARDRWLAPGGVMVPGTITAYLAPACVTEFNEEQVHWRSKPHGVDLGVIARMTAHEMFHTQARLTPADLVAPGREMWHHDPYVTSLQVADSPFVSNLTFTATRTGMMSGVVAWFTAAMGDGTMLTTAVGEPMTHWGRSFFPLDRAVEVVAGTKVQTELRCDPSTPGNCEFSWTVQIGDRAAEVHDTRMVRRELVLADANR